MFQIYILNWADRYNVVTGSYTLIEKETMVLGIPTGGPYKIWLDKPVVKAEVNKAESFDFTVTPGSDYYNAFLPMKTWLRVVYDTHTIFFGRVKSITNSTLFQTRSIHAEGVYSVLNDTPIEGIEEEHQSDTTIHGRLMEVIDSHNSYAEDNLKKFSIGNIQISLGSESKKRGATSWTTSVNEIDKLIDEAGGYIRARYNDNYPNNGAQRNYIDWVQHYFRDLGDYRPTIKLAKNLIDISKGVENNEIFTRMIPVGNKSVTTESKESKFVYLNGSKYIRVPQLVAHYGEAALNTEFQSASDFANAEKNYGVIYKTVNFANASTPSELEGYAYDWIKRNYFGIINNFSIKAIDMHIIGENEQPILVGDCVNVVYPEYDNDGTVHEISRKLICKAVQYNLFNPEQNMYTFGVPCEAVDFEYGSKKKKASKAAAQAEQERVSAPPGGGGTTTIRWETVRNLLYYYYYSISYTKVVDWTETRFVKYTNPAGPATAENIKINQRDRRPHTTFSNNGEYVAYERRQNGVDEQQQPTYENVPIYTYVTISTPGNGSKVKARVMGFYELTMGIDEAKYNSGSGGKYCVVVSTTGHIYVVGWDRFSIALQYRTRDGDTYVIPNNHVLSAYFEIANISSAKMVTDVVEQASGQGTSETVENKSPEYVWKTTDGKTAADLATEMGLMRVGFHVDPDTGTVTPLVKLNAGISYIDKDGIPRTTTDACITAADLQLRHVDSFETEIGVIHDLIADRITTTELVTYKLEVGREFDEVERSLIEQGKTVATIDRQVVVIGGHLDDVDLELLDHNTSITTIKSDITRVNTLVAKYGLLESPEIGDTALHVIGDAIIDGTVGAAVEGNRRIGGFDGDNFWMEGERMNVLDVTVSGNTLSIYRRNPTTYEFETLTFSKATSLDPVWSGSGEGLTGNKLTINAIQNNSGQRTTVASTSIGIGAVNADTMLDISHALTTTGAALPKWVTGTYKVSTYSGGGTPTVRYGPIEFTVDATPAWENGESSGKTTGWNAAYGLTIVPGSGSGGFITCKWPSASYNSAISRDYILRNSDDNDDVVNLQYISSYIPSGPVYTTVATLNHGKYTAGVTKGESSGKTTGWNLAKGKVVIPGSNSGTQFTVKFPGTSYNSQDSRTYILDDDGDNAVEVICNNGQGDVQIARYSHNKYTSGRNSVYVSSVKAEEKYESQLTDEFTVTAKASNDKTKDAEFYLTKTTTTVYVNQEGVGKVAKLKFA